MEITRGDYDVFKFKRTMNGEVIETMPDKVYFTVKRSEYEDDFLFQKRLNEGIVIDKDFIYNVEITPEDTNDLDFGDYIYDIEIVAGDKPKTIDKGVFKITYEVTTAKNEV